ncbi:MAG: tetratricopeptide repeat protein, partial [Flavobacteriales bacterium]|nr:tetratricopeptide repeat protein [Flavobacteriales bacterium]
MNINSFILLLLFIAGTFTARAGHYPDHIQSKIDSITTSLTNLEHDSLRWNAYLDLTYYSCNYDLNAALGYCHKALDIAKKANHEKELSEVYVWLGYLYTQNNSYAEAIVYLQEGLLLSEKLGEEDQMGSLYCNIGMCHDFLDDGELAEQYYEKALAIYTKLGNLQNMAINIGNIASLERRKGNIKRALELNVKALVYLAEINDEPSMALTVNNIGHIEKSRKNYPEALKNFLRSAEIFSKNKHRKGEALAYANISDVYIKLGNLKEAEAYALKSYKLANELQIPESMMNASNFLSTIYEKTDRHHQALEMYKTYILMKDSISNDENQKTVAKQEARYAYEKQKALDKKEHEKQLAIEQEAKEKQQILTYATAGGLGLVGVFLFVVFNRLKVTRKQKVAIEEAHSELEEKNQEILDSINYAKRIQSAILP